MIIDTQLNTIKARLERVEELNELQNERGVNDIRRRLIVKHLDAVDVALTQIRERNRS